MCFRVTLEVEGLRCLRADGQVDLPMSGNAQAYRSGEKLNAGYRTCRYYWVGVDGPRDGVMHPAYRLFRDGFRRSRSGARCALRAKRPSAATAAEAADGAAIVVVNAAQTENVLLGEGGVASMLKPGSVIIASLTLSPAEAQDFAARAAAKGILYSDAPIRSALARRSRLSTSCWPACILRSPAKPSPSQRTLALIYREYSR